MAAVSTNGTTPPAGAPVNDDLRLVPGSFVYDPKAAAADYAADPQTYVALFGAPPGPPPPLAILIPGRFVLAGLVGLLLLIYGFGD